MEKKITDYLLSRKKEIEATLLRKKNLMDSYKQLEEEKDRINRTLIEIAAVFNSIDSAALEKEISELTALLPEEEKKED